MLLPKWSLFKFMMNFEYQPCGIFEGLDYPQEVEYIVPVTFEKSAGLGNRTKKLVS